MKKLVAVILTLALVLMSVSALADIRISNLKVEIDAALQAYAAEYSKTAGFNVEASSVGGGADYSGSVKAELQAGNMPDIFVIEGLGGYNEWKDYIEDLSDTEFAKNTSVAFTVDGKVYGFPVAVEGFGLAYNKDLLEKAGIDPATLTNYDAYAAAFEKLDSMKAELGLDMVVSMVAGTTTGMTWVTGLHNFNVYLTVGNQRNDTTYIDQVLEGKVDEERFHQYCQYVALLFQYSTQDMLLNGTQDSQLAAFANGKAAFYHQGNWMDPSLVLLNPDFEIAYAPHPFLHEDTDGILVNPPSWYVVNENGNKDEAIAYLNYLATSEDGADYMVNKAAMVPAFTNVTLAPSTPLSKSVMEWNAAGKTYDWQQYKLPDGFGMGTLGQIYELFAAQAIDVDTFELMMKDAIAGIAK